MTSGVVLVSSLLLTLNRFHTLFRCFYSYVKPCQIYLLNGILLNFCQKKLRNQSFSCNFAFAFLMNAMYISSRPEVFSEKGVLRKFAKFTGKHLCQSLFFNKVAGLRPATLLKKRLWHRCFPMNFAKFLRTAFLTEHLRWLLLYVKK